VVKPLILVVDDSPTVRKLVAGTLTTAGYRVVEAESGYAAADLIRTQGVPALFLLDVNMPGMDGFTLCKSLRSSPETAKVPVVFLTGKDGFISKLRSQWAGASDYLTKAVRPAAAAGHGVQTGPGRATRLTVIPLPTAMSRSPRSTIVINTPARVRPAADHNRATQLDVELPDPLLGAEARGRRLT